VDDPMTNEERLEKLEVWRESVLKDGDLVTRIATLEGNHSKLLETHTKQTTDAEWRERAVKYGGWVGAALTLILFGVSVDRIPEKVQLAITEQNIPVKVQTEITGAALKQSELVAQTRSEIDQALGEINCKLANLSKRESEIDIALVRADDVIKTFDKEKIGEISKSLESFVRNKDAAKVVAAIRSIRSFSVLIIIARKDAAQDIADREFGKFRIPVMTISEAQFGKLLAYDITDPDIFKGVTSIDAGALGQTFLLPKDEEILICSASIRNEYKAKLSAQLVFPTTLQSDGQTHTPQRDFGIVLRGADDAKPNVVFAKSDDGTENFAVVSVTMAVWRSPNSFESAGSQTANPEGGE